MMRCTQRTTRHTLLATSLLACLALGAGAAAARQDSDPKWQQPDAAATAEPAGQSAVAGIDDALTDLAKDPLFDEVPVDWTGLLDFYAEHDSPALFTTPTGFTELGLKLQARLPEAAAVGLRVPAAVQSALAALKAPTTPETQAMVEAYLAAVFVGFAVDANAPLGDGDLSGAGVMSEIAATADANTLLDWQLPTYYRFWALLDRLPEQLALYEAGGWPEVPTVKKLEPGQSAAIVPALRRRLAVTGELDAASVEAGDVYDPGLVAAVALFQRNHGLNDDGVVGGRTLEELNVTAETRVRQILLNLDRMREEGPHFESRHLIANIPSQEVKVIENGQVTFYTKAIFGKLERKSPTLSSVIHTVKLNPDWTAPYKIAAIDEVRRERANPGFLEAKGFTIYDKSGNVVSPRSINWHEVGPGNFPYTLRQAPGPENALGPVKFDFPNDHSVFLHGTPTVKLFDKQDRFFSSGCVRTETPIDLAEFMLRDDPEWPRDRIDAVIRTGKTTLVKLRNPLPVHITYMTAWVDEAGVMQFRKDAYGYDDLPKLPDSVAVLVATAPGELYPNRD